jgi:uncharacterized protein YjiS (DUF1127 family)
MQQHILYLAGLARPLVHDRPVTARHEARARIERADAAHDALVALGHGIASRARDLARRVRRRRLAMATIRELEALDDRMLADIGLVRAGIRGLAWSVAGGDASPASPAAPVAAETEPAEARAASRDAAGHWKRAA